MSSGLSIWLAVLEAGRQARSAAHAGDWDTFLTLEGAYLEALTATQNSPVDVASLEEPQREAFSLLVKEVYALHHETTQLATAHRDALASEIQATTAENKLAKLYE